MLICRLVLRDRGDRLVPSQFWMSPEMRGDASVRFAGTVDVLALDIVDRFLDDLFDAFAADEKPVGIAKQVGFRNQFLDSMFVELAFDECDELVGGQRVQLDALREQKFRLFAGRAVQTQSSPASWNRGLDRKRLRRCPRGRVRERRPAADRGR